MLKLQTHHKVKPQNLMRGAESQSRAGFADVVIAASWTSQTSTRTGRLPAFVSWSPFRAARSGKRRFQSEAKELGAIWENSDRLSGSSSFSELLRSSDSRV